MRLVTAFFLFFSSFAIPVSNCRQVIGFCLKKLKRSRSDVSFLPKSTICIYTHWPQIIRRTFQLLCIIDPSSVSFNLLCDNQCTACRTGAIFFACFRLTRTRTWSARHGRREKAQKKYIPPSRVFRAPRPQRARLQNERKNSAYSRIKYSCPHLSRHECLQRNKTSMATFGGSTSKLVCERAHLGEFGENVFGDGTPIPRGERDAGCGMRAPTPKQFSPNSHK